MPALRLIYLLCFLVIQSIHGFSQEEHVSSYRLQLSGGIGYSLHYGKPITFLICYGACIPLEHTPELGGNGGISLYRRMSHNQEINVGLGFNQYHFSNQGIYQSDVVTEPDKPYEENLHFTYLHIQAGHRLNFAGKNKYLFLENNILLEINASSQFNHSRKAMGLAYKCSFGPQLQLSRSISFQIGSFFKTGLMRYNRIETVRNYVPWEAGVEIGLSKIF